MGLLACPVQGQEQDSMIHEGLFQLRIFCEFVMLRIAVHAQGQAFRLGGEGLFPYPWFMQVECLWSW